MHPGVVAGTSSSSSGPKAASTTLWQQGKSQNECESSPSRRSPKRTAGDGWYEQVGVAVAVSPVTSN